MSLKTERKIKFWLTTIAKIIFIVFIAFKAYDYISSRKTEHKTTVTDINTPEKDTLKLKKEIKAQNRTSNTTPPKKVAEPTIQNTIKKNIPTFNKNAISIIIYNRNETDHEITNHLENSLFQEYELTLPPAKALKYKNALLQGDLSLFKNLKTQYVVIGKVTYNYKRSTISSNTIICTVNVQFNTYNIATNTKNRDLSKSINVSGIGFSQEEAKANAIKKI